MAEILIRNKDSWMDSVSKDTWSEGMWAKYNRRKQRGDIICVRQDDFEWAEGEVPNVVKINIPYEEALKYEQTDYTLDAKPNSHLEDFLEKEIIDQLNETERITVLEAEKQKIQQITIKNLKTTQSIVGDLNTTMNVLSREALEGEEGEIEITADTTERLGVKLSVEYVHNIHTLCRFKLVDNKIIDKVTLQETEI